MRINNYIFDFDGTLADSKECSVLATKEAFKTFGLSIPSDHTIEYYMGIPIEKSFREMANKTLKDNEFEKLLDIFRGKYKDFENDTLCTFEDIPEVLASLSEQGKKLFVVSSKKSDVLFRNLQSLNINQYFTEAIGSDKVENYKPHPDGIRKILSQYNLVQDETIYIGDAIFDIQMATNAKVSSCAVTWGSHNKQDLMNEEPTFIVENVKDIAQLEEINGNI